MATLTPAWASINNTAAVARANADRDRLVVKVRSASPNRSTLSQADAGHLPLFIAANEPAFL